MQQRLEFKSVDKTMRQRFFFCWRAGRVKVNANKVVPHKIRIEYNKTFFI